MTRAPHAVLAIGLLFPRYGPTSFGAWSWPAFLCFLYPGLTFLQFAPSSFSFLFPLSCLANPTLRFWPIAAALAAWGLLFLRESSGFGCHPRWEIPPPSGERDWCGGWSSRPVNFCSKSPQVAPGKAAMYLILPLQLQACRNDELQTKRCMFSGVLSSRWSFSRAIQTAMALRRGAPSPVASTENYCALSKVQAAFQPILHDASQVVPGRKYRTLEDVVVRCWTTVIFKYLYLPSV